MKVNIEIPAAWGRIIVIIVIVLCAYASGVDLSGLLARV